MQNLTFAAFWLPFFLGWLPTKIWNMPFCFFMWPPRAPWEAPPLPLLLHFPYLVWVINLFCYFSIPSRYRPEDLTFKWQLFPDLFINLAPVPTGTRSEASCPTASVCGQNSRTAASFGDVTRRSVTCRSRGGNLALCTRHPARLCIVMKHDIVWKYRRL